MVSMPQYTATSATKSVEIMVPITANLQAVHARIARAAQAANRLPEDIHLLAVSKTFEAALVAEAWRAGQRTFGENFVQEVADKARALTDFDIEWHFIGPIQSNKTKLIAENCAWVHSIDREKIAQRLNAARPAHLPPLNVLIQVNVSGEASKGGVAPGTEQALAAAIRTLPRLRLRGLMAIPEPSADTATQRAPFALLRRLKEALQADDANIDTLSMGMSGDLEAAIAEGATIVRVGTAIFGSRSP